LQKILGAINWVRPLLGIMTEDLHPLFNLLNGDTALTSPRWLTADVQQALKRVTQAISQWQVHRVIVGLPTTLHVFNPAFQPYGLLGQWGEEDTQDPLRIL
ncbi:POK19 protein, partial [Baryphthengus martii]|nr:POK19 protein [Baryphthengus martii]